MLTRPLVSAPERCILAGLVPSGDLLNEAEDSLNELARLVETAGATSVGRVIQVREKPNNSTYFGGGKVCDLKQLIVSKRADLLIVDDQLRPGQQTNLENLLGVRVVDRTALILDIFALHAHSAEGKIQVELAQLRYRLTRLTGQGAELSRLGAGIGTRGPGEQKLEVNRRRTRRRITTLEQALNRADQTRRVKRHRRLGSGIPMAALVGYTNAGKSTLLNGLTSSKVVAQDQLFSTLDTVSSRLELPGGRIILLSDTVGFVKNVPHELIDAFRSTLEEVCDAQLLIHVVDAGAADPESQIAAVRSVLGEIGAGQIPELLVLNKSDIATPYSLRRLAAAGESVVVSAITGEGLAKLVDKIVELLGRYEIEVELFLPYEDARSLAQLRGECSILSEVYQPEGSWLKVLIPKVLIGKYAKFVRTGSSS